jgi:hypothetical protein
LHTVQTLLSFVRCSLIAKAGDAMETSYGGYGIIKGAGAFGVGDTALQSQMKKIAH